MAQQQANGRLTNEGAMAVLANLLAGVILTGAEIHLYLSSFSPTTRNVAADFIAAEATFTGYAPQTLTWSALGIDGAGTPTALSDRAFFQATDAVNPNDIGGVFITHDTTGPDTHTAVEFYPFGPTIPMTTALAFMGVVLGMQLPAGAGYAMVDN